MRFQKNTSIILLALLLGLFPSFSLLALRVMLLAVIISVAMRFRQIDRGLFERIRSYPNFAFAQFAAFFLVNALVFDVLDGNRTHYRAVAMENWSVTLICLGLFALWFQLHRAEDVKQALIRWLPMGLTGSFLVATLVYVWGSQGSRIEIFSPGPLSPPFWFLVLTMCSFTWFFEMSHTHKIWRIALFFMAGVMVVYGSARLVMLAWGVCSVFLAVWIYTQSAPKFRVWVLLGTGFFFVLGVGGVLLADMAASSLLLRRMQAFGAVDFTYDSISTQFLRLKIWAGALSVISENPLSGIGNVNERIALRQEMEWDRWLSAHQTYLSYLIAGGIPALISGLILQSPVLAFLSRARRSTFFPAFLGLGVVVTMNCLTDSIFQSAVNVQVFMVATLIFLRASDADQPTLAPQKQVSSAAA